MSLTIEPTPDFAHILRVANTSVDGRLKLFVALCAIRGVGRRFAILACKKANVDHNARAGAVSKEDVEKVIAVLNDPASFAIPDYLFNRRCNYKDGINKHTTGAVLDSVIRTDLERLKKIRCNRGLRHFWGIRVRGQQTGDNGRHGAPNGVIRKSMFAAQQ
eukprot:GHVH01008595.1.p2 GENE.GHVH01008595.1~~GHVH01008595.1.p2  ORF type:complete len:161 (+),score=25.63 GHVH01008595.1:72-554(+)